MAHDVAVNMFYTNRVKQTITENDGANDGIIDDDTNNNDAPVDDDTSDEVHFDDDEKSEIISIVFTEMRDRLKV